MLGLPKSKTHSFFRVASRLPFTELTMRRGVRVNEMDSNPEMRVHSIGTSRQRQTGRGGDMAEKRRNRSPRLLVAPSRPLTLPATAGA